MTNRQFYESGNKKATEAVKADQEGRFSDAIYLYQQALIHYQTGLYYEKMPSTGRIITTHTEAYMKRVEELQFLLKANEVEPDNPISPQQQQHASQVMNNEMNNNDPDRENNQSIAEMQVKPNVTWKDIIGMSKIKTILYQSVILPREMPHIFVGNRQPSRSILLYGPPGVGKTEIAKALANESNMAFFVITSTDIINKYIGESERNVRRMFETIRQHRPCILFIDEIDSLCKDRSDSNDKTNTIQEFLTQMDGITNNLEGILFMGNTNRPWVLDDGILRRFNRRIYVPLPDLGERFELLQYYLSKNKDDVDSSITDEALLELSGEMQHFSGSDIKSFIHSAYQKTISLITDATHYKAIKDKDGQVFVIPCESNEPGAKSCLYSQIKDKTKIHAPSITIKHLKETMSICKPSVNLSYLEKYENWTKEYGEDAS